MGGSISRSRGEVRQARRGLSAHACHCRPSRGASGAAQPPADEPGYHGPASQRHLSRPNRHQRDHRHRPWLG